MAYQFNVPQPFAPKQQPQAGSLFDQQLYGAKSWMTPQQQGAAALQQKVMPKPIVTQPKPIVAPPAPIARPPYTPPRVNVPTPTPAPAPHPLTGNFQPIGYQTPVNTLTAPLTPPVPTVTGLNPPTTYVGKTAQPEPLPIQVSQPMVSAPPAQPIQQPVPQQMQQPMAATPAMPNVAQSMPGYMPQQAQGGIMALGNMTGHDYMLGEASGLDQGMF